MDTFGEPFRSDWKAIAFIFEGPPPALLRGIVYTREKISRKNRIPIISGSSTMDSSDRLQLEKMIQANNVVDCTQDIRRKNHSQPIRTDVRRMVELRKQYARLRTSNPDQYDRILVSRCNFLFTHYTDIFNKVKKEELDLNTLWSLLDVLGKIESGDLDQHSAAFEVGTLLKKMYVDAALVKAKRLDEAQGKSKPEHKVEKTLTWKQYKERQASKN